MTQHTDEFYMAKAIKLAQKGHYTTHPNPSVGCVLVKNNHIIGEGYHVKAGELHAERNALAMSGDKAHACTAYVTLEPCSHTGKTPPCADGLIEAGVKRVVIAMQDPNPLVAGKGIQKLLDAGIAVDQIRSMEASARALNLGFIKRMEQGLPYVRCKMGMSLDGRTAMKNGESQWITGAEARQDVQKLRAESAVIMTGIGTLMADDPSMNVRLSPQQLGLPSGYTIRQPIKVLIDSQLQCSIQAKLLNKSAELWIFCHQNASTTKMARLKKQGAKIFPIERDNLGLSLSKILRTLAKLGINDVLLETGAKLAGSALQQNLVDELIIYTAPVLLGDQARGLCHLPLIEQLSDKLEWQYKDVRLVGKDLRLILERK